MIHTLQFALRHKAINQTSVKHMKVLDPPVPPNYRLWQ